MSGRRVIMVAVAFAVAAALVTAATASSEATTVGGSYKLVGKWGAAGKSNGQFGSNAFGLATDKSGDVYVADSDNHRIQRFSAKGAFKGKFAFTPGSEVMDVAIDSDGNVWGTDQQAAVAHQFTREGRPLASLGTPKSAEGIGAGADGSIYIATYGDQLQLVIRFDKSGSGYAQAKSWAGFQAPSDVEASPDRSVWVSDNVALNLKRFDANGKLLKTIKAGPSAPLGIGVDLDCNVLVGDIAQRRLVKYSPSGRLLATAASPDLIAQDVAVGPTGDLYAFDGSTRSIVHFAENRAKPATAAVPGKIKVSKGKATIKYTAAGIACPAQVGAVATLSGKGVSGRAAVKVAAGRNTVLSIPVKAPAGKSVPATFKIVLKTNGRSTTETRKVIVASAK